MFKKINMARPKQEVANPEINSLFSNYIKICELNENIRRTELIKPKRY